MTTHYHPWFQLLLTHEYFGGSFKDFRLEPTAETFEQLKNSNIISKFTDKAIEFFIGTNSQELDLPSALDGLETLEFILDINDYHFINYTEIALQEPMQLYLFENTPGDSKLKNTGVIDRMTLHNIPPYGTFVLLRLHVPSNTTTQLTLAFENREVFFRYYIIPRNENMELQEAHIQHPRGIRFIKSEQTEQFGDKPAMVFQSEIPLPLLHTYKEFPTLHLTWLKDQRRINEETHLPSPNSQELTAIAENQFVAKMYIYV